MTGVALITFILLARDRDPHGPGAAAGLDLRDARDDGDRVSALSYFINEAHRQSEVRQRDKMNFEAPLTSLVWLTSIVSIALTYRGFRS